MQIPDIPRNTNILALSRNETAILIRAIGKVYGTSACEAMTQLEFETMQELENLLRMVN